MSFNDPLSILLVYEMFDLVSGQVIAETLEHHQEVRKDDHLLTRLQSLDNFEYLVDLCRAMVSIKEVSVDFLPDYHTLVASKYRTE